MESKSFNLGRRRFLQTSGVALATAAMAPRVLANELALHPKRLSIGFASLDGDGRISSAAGILSTDGAFIGKGARVTVFGNRGTKPSARRGVELLVHYSYDNNGTRADAPFTAWAGCRKTNCADKPVSFTVPVDVDQRVLFSVNVKEPVANGRSFMNRVTATAATAPAAATSLPVELSLLGTAGSHKLARGFYFIAPLFEGDSEPSWSSCELKNNEGQWSLVERSLFEDAKPAAFEHFILRIDYAG